MEETQEDELNQRNSCRDLCVYESKEFCQGFYEILFPVANEVKTKVDFSDKFNFKSLLSIRSD